LYCDNSLTAERVVR